MTTPPTQTHRRRTPIILRTPRDHPCFFLFILSSPPYLLSSPRGIIFSPFFGRTMGRSQKNRRRSLRQYLCCHFDVVAVVIHMRCIAQKIKISCTSYLNIFPYMLWKPGWGKSHPYIRRGAIQRSLCPLPTEVPGRNRTQPRIQASPDLA